MDDFYFKSLVQNAVNGLLCRQMNTDTKYITDHKATWEVHLVDDAFKIAYEVMRRFDEKEALKQKPD